MQRCAMPPRRLPARPPLRLALACWLTLAVPVLAQSPPPSFHAAVTARLDALRVAVPTAEVAIALHDLETGARYALHDTVVFHAASTMKVPVLIDLVREADAGRLSLDETLPLTNTFRSIVDGSPYTLDPADDSDDTVYARVGESVPLRWLAERMITHSSNLATNALIARLDPMRITRTMAAFGATRTQVRRGVEDGPAYRAGLNNVTTAGDLATILETLERGRAASPDGTTFLRDVLLAQHFRGEIPAGLPAGTRVAHKTGWISGTLHDAAIVYPEGRAPFVLVVLTRGIPDEPTAARFIADVARLAWTSR
jgi:beta-lactamase class A